MAQKKKDLKKKNCCAAEDTHKKSKSLSCLCIHCAVFQTVQTETSFCDGYLGSVSIHCAVFQTVRTETSFCWRLSWWCHYTLCCLSDCPNRNKILLKVILVVSVYTVLSYRLSKQETSFCDGYLGGVSSIAVGVLSRWTIFSACCHFSFFFFFLFIKSLFT